MRSLMRILCKLMKIWDFKLANSYKKKDVCQVARVATLNDTYAWWLHLSLYLLGLLVWSDAWSGWVLFLESLL